MRSPSLSRAWLLTVVLLLAQVVVFAGYWPLLPEWVAQNFDFDGHAQSWAPRGLFMGILGGVSGLMLLSCHGLALLLPWIPSSLINVPHREYWLAEGRRDATLVKVQASMLFLGNLTLAFLLVVGYLVLDANLQPQPRLSAGFTWAVVIYGVVHGGMDLALHGGVSIAFALGVDPNVVVLAALMGGEPPRQPWEGLQNASERFVIGSRPSMKRISSRVVTVAPLSLGLLSASLPARAAQEDDPTGGSEASASVDLKGSAKGKKERQHLPWIKRWAPERNMGEVGIYGGLLFPSRKLELFEADPNLPDQGRRQFERVAGDIGIRGGYYPLRFLGVEAELGLMPGQTTNDQNALFWTFRGHVVGQLGLWSVTPFVLFGAGGFNVASDRDAVGNDVDPALHFGAGVKFFINRYIQARFDVRDNISASTGVDTGSTNSWELLLGLSVTLGRKKDKPPPKPGDRDGDGILDPDDKCIDEPGIPPDGCPPPPGDRDGDGFLDTEDVCPDEPGVAPDGCPIPDTDGDGFLDPDDKCVHEPETKNGYQDGDGCPDEVPKAVQDFTGVIEGIYFDTNKDVIKRRSRKILDHAVEVLSEHPSIRVEVSGHTSSTGSREHNLDLSWRRAEAVKNYLIDRGIDAERLETRGAGPDEPIADNDTSKGRGKNRRIEFKIIEQ